MSREVSAVDHEPTEPAAVQHIEDALGRLDGLPERPVAEHADAFDELHAVLVEALSTVESTVESTTDEV